MTTPTDRDLEVAREIADAIEYDGGHLGIVTIIQMALAQRESEVRRSLPSRVIEALEFAREHIDLRDHNRYYDKALSDLRDWLEGV